MNPFQAHSNNMTAYLAQLNAAPISSTQAENTISYGAPAQVIPAVVGRFERRDVFVGAGRSPFLVGEVIVQRSAIPAGVVFQMGNDVTAVQTGGQVHVCQIKDIAYPGAEVRLTLWDVNQKA